MLPIFACDIAWKLASLLGIDVQSILRVRLLALVYFMCAFV